MASESKGQECKNAGFEASHFIAAKNAALYRKDAVNIAYLSAVEAWRCLAVITVELVHRCAVAQLRFKTAKFKVSDFCF